MRKCISICLFAAVSFGVTGCFQAYSDGEDFRTVPVTNNPNIVPNHSPIPGMGGATPY